MFDAVLKILKKSDRKVTDRLLPRLRVIVEQVNGIGWGYFDYIAGALELAFPEERND